MKRALVVFLIFVALGFAYIPYSFRYLSTSGILWDDYDWFLADPARIPLIEGYQLYTSLANFVSGEENVFSDSVGFQGPGFFLIGGKAFGPPLGIAGVFDTRMLRIADPTGIGDYLGYGSTADTSNVVNPDDGSIISKGINTEIREAYHTHNNFDGYFGLGYQLNETFNLGFAFDHASVWNDSIAPDRNSIITSRDYTGGSLDSYDSTYIEGHHITQDMSNRVRFGAWTEMDYLQLSGYLGAEMFSGDAGRDTIGSYSLTESYGDPATTTINWTTNLENWRYSGLAFPIELLGIYELDEGADLWFSGGFEYNMWSWKDGAGVSDVSNDTSLTTTGGVTATAIGIDSTLTAGSGKGSGMTYSLGSKGVFELNEMVSFGLGIHFRGASTKDSTLNEHSDATFVMVDDGDGVDEFDDYTTTTYTSSSDYLVNKAFLMAFDFPVGVEFRPVKPLALRLGATFTHQMNTYTEHIQGIGTQVFESHTVRGDGTTEDIITYSPYTISNEEEKRKETLDEVTYNFGIGIKITKNLQIDLMGFTDLLDLGNWRLSVIFKF